MQLGGHFQSPVSPISYYAKFNSRLITGLDVKGKNGTNFKRKGECFYNLVLGVVVKNVGFRVNLQ